MQTEQNRKIYQEKKLYLNSKNGSNEMKEWEGHIES